MKSVVTFPAILAALVLALAACNDHTAQPPPAGPDTTSHDFSYRTFVIGEPGSILYDVAVINDTLAYAVGEIYTLDSAGKVDLTPYGIAIWNGRDWRLHRVKAFYRPDYGALIRAFGIFAFSASDVWLADGDVYHWDGSSDTMTIHRIGVNGTNPNPILDEYQGVIKIWGSSPSDLYAVGVRGAAAHFNGTSWRRIESGTTAPIQDVWGARDPKTGEQTVLCAASDPTWFSDQRIIRLHADGTADTLARNINRKVASVWFRSMEKIFTAGSGVFIHSRDAPWVEQAALPPYFTFRVRGQNDNDVFAVGDRGLIAHNNGRDWRTWIIPDIKSVKSCDYKGRTCVAVGFTPETRAAAVVFQR